MNWQLLQRRLPLPLAGCVLGVGGYFAMLRPATANSLVWSSDVPAASQPILQALKLDPGSPERWADLAEALHESGREADVRYCLEQEMSRGGHLPHVAMRTAGMYFRLGDPVTALGLTKRIVRDTREYDANVFQLWARLGGTPTAVFEHGIGNNTVAGRGYFQFLLGSGSAGTAGAAWTELKSRNMAGVDEARAYAEVLKNSRDYEQAAVVEAAILPDGVWNGGFENEWSRVGLDWKAESVTGVAVSRDLTEHHSGAASLRLAFDGRSRETFEKVSAVRVLPGGRWTVRAAIRTDLKGTATGIGFRVQDLVTGRVLAQTNRVSGIAGWTAVEASFEAGAAARPVSITVERPATPASELPMTGTAWVDDVTLTREKAR